VLLDVALRLLCAIADLILGHFTFLVTVAAASRPVDLGK
jgi:hypothetical protein